MALKIYHKETKYFFNEIGTPFLAIFSCYCTERLTAYHSVEAI